MSEDTIIATTMFAAIFGILYVIVASRHRQRMAMIEKGLTVAPITTATKSSWAYALGLLSIGIGAGIGLGWFVDKVMFGSEWGNNPLPYFLCILLSGGGALIVYHRWVEKRRA